MLSQFFNNNYIIVKYLETYFCLNYYTNIIYINDKIFVIFHLKTLRIIQLDIL